MSNSMFGDRVRPSAALMSTFASDGDAASRSPSSPPPPITIPSFDVLHEPGTRRFFMVRDTDTSGSNEEAAHHHAGGGDGGGQLFQSVVVCCIVSNRPLPPLHDDSTQPPHHQTPQPASRWAAYRREDSSAPAVQRARRVALPTYALDRLPVSFTAFVTQRGGRMTLEAQLCSQGGALCVDGATVHRGPMRDALMDVSYAARRYRGPVLSDRHLADAVCCPQSTQVNPLMPYRQCLRQYFDPFVHRLADSSTRFDHDAVHTAPAHVTEAVVALLREAGIDDALAAFVHRYALYVQRCEDAKWRSEMITAFDVKKLMDPLHAPSHRRQLSR